MANNSAPRIAPREGLLDEVKAALGDSLVEAREAVGEVSLTVVRESLVEVCRILRDAADKLAPGTRWEALRIDMERRNCRCSKCSADARQRDERVRAGHGDEVGD